MWVVAVGGATGFCACGDERERCDQRGGCCEGRCEAEEASFHGIMVMENLRGAKQNEVKLVEFVRWAKSRWI